jgi:squalene-hopene/tetraprenyl-beta-curcumene cyclase
MMPVSRAGLTTAAVPVLDVEPRRGLEAAIRSASQYLLERQNPEGYWLGELEADTTLESDYILLHLWLYPPGADGKWSPPTGQKLEKAARYILGRQLPDGGWNLYPGGPANISACVKAYFALKLAGLAGSQECLKRARRRILELGGVEAANSYTKIYLSYFDLYERGQVPTIPAELFLLPKETGFSVYEMSSWSRAMLAPLAILGGRRAKRPLPADFDLGEIFTGNGPAAPEPISLRNVFLWIDRGLKVWERNGYKPAREKAVAAAAEWMIEHLKDSDGLGAIYPAMLNSIMALTELGYGLDDPLLARELAKFEELVIEEPDTLRVQPCLSPVWDTALASYAIGSANPEESGASRQALTRAADWLQTREVRKKGDWAVKNSKAEPGGWYFEFANEFYPDTDDTAKVLLACQFARANDPAAQRATVRRAVDWLLGMQSSDGGWAAFDVDNNSQLLTHVPFSARWGLAACTVPCAAPSNI